MQDIDSNIITYSKGNNLISDLDILNCYNSCESEQPTLNIKLKVNNKNQKWFKGSNDRGLR